MKRPGLFLLGWACLILSGWGAAAPAPTLISPASKEATKGPIVVTFSLPQPAQDGSVQISFRQGNAPSTTTQTFTLTASSGTVAQINALQVRSAQPFWSGQTNGNWDTSTGNWTGGQSYSALTAAGVRSLLRTEPFGCRSR